VIRFDAILWDDPADPTGNGRHIARHGLTTAEVEDVLRSPTATDGVSRSSGRKLVFGWTRTGKFIVVSYDIRQTRATVMIEPVTAYEVAPH